LWMPGVRGPPDRTRVRHCKPASVELPAVMLPLLLKPAKVAPGAERFPVWPEGIVHRWTE